jgi:hypothetical protein
MKSKTISLVVRKKHFDSAVRAWRKRLVSIFEHCGQCPVARAAKDNFPRKSFQVYALQMKATSGKSVEWYRMDSKCANFIKMFDAITTALFEGNQSKHLAALRTKLPMTIKLREIPLKSVIPVYKVASED